MTLIQKIKNLFRASTITRTKNWMDRLNELGFDKIAFPILIKDGSDLNLVSLDKFAIDPDLNFHEFDSKYELIDSNGKLWAWKYDTANKINLPGTFLRTVTLNEVKEIVNTYFKNSKLKNEIQILINQATSIHDLLNKLENKF